MPPPSLLVTDRPAFEQTWRSALSQVGFSPKLINPEVIGGAVNKGDVVVIDAGSELFDEDELLATAGLARAVGGTVAVVLPADNSLSAIEEVLADVCPGLLARNASDVERVALALGRRADADRARRFEYLTVSPRPDELLAILGDGSSTLLKRPVNKSDDNTEVASITLADDARTASITLASGAQFVVRADEVAGRAAVGLLSSANGSSGTNGGVIDGARLGAKLRALRLAAGLTQAELARRTGIHRPNIARVEAGRHTPSLETLARLAHAIGVPTTHVLADD